MGTILQSSPRKQKQTPNHLYFPTVNNSLASYQLSASKKFISGRSDHRDVTEEAKGSLLPSERVSLAGAAGTCS